MKLLVVAPRLPFPLDKGDRLTVFHLLRYFSQRHEVFFVCFLEPDQKQEWIAEISGFCRKLEVVPLSRARAYTKCVLGLLGRVPLQIRYYADRRMHRAVGRMIEKEQPDLIYGHLIRMAQYVQPHSCAPRVLALNVSMSLNYRRLAENAQRLVSKALFSIEHAKVQRYEPELARDFERALFISPYDVEATKAEPPLENVFYNPHGVDFEYFSPDPKVEKYPKSLIFTGNMGYPPNADAALYFVREILPRVRSAVPSVRLEIAGADPLPEVLALATDASVSVTGRVPDLRPYMNRAEVAIAPIRVGAGLQNKILEGMAMELPMVVTSVANEGIQATHGKHLLVADSVEGFADAVTSLLDDREKRQVIGSAAREFITSSWSWEAHFRNLEEMFLKLTKM